MVEGFVVDISGEKTAKVNVVKITRHPLYGKVVKKNKMIACQIGSTNVRCGDKVIITSCKPYSKTKKHIIVKKA